MRFPVAWASVALQNVTLKVCLVVLGATSIILSFTTTKLALKPAIVIERACYSTVISPASSQHSTTEIEFFLHEALSYRFNTEVVVKEGFISSEELKFRGQEQAELKRREMNQKVILNSPIKVNGDSVSADTDRLISVGKIRSAFSFPITITLSKTMRTETNPYGLMIEKISGQQLIGGEDGNKKGK